MTRRLSAFASLVALAVVGAATVVTYGYSTYGRWAVTPVVFYVNPANADVSASAAESALQAAMAVWNDQSGSAFRFSYGGRANDTTTGYDGRNVVIFRNQSNGGTLASTYSWSSGGTLVDSDIVFWDGGFQFFTGTSGCSAGAYIEDVGVHELGHALGLGHSDHADSTMYPTYGWCSQAWRTLASDDINGIRSLYGSTGSAPVNTAPTVTISAPASGASVQQGASLAFAGSASDTEDGTITAQIVWTSNLDGQIGTGGSFSRVLSAGSHTIQASVTDLGGLTAVRQVGVTVTASTASASPDGALVPSVAQIVDSQSAVWTIGAGQVILRNGTHAAGGYGSKILWSGGVIYVFGTDSNWWKWLGNGWSNVGSTQPGSSSTATVPAAPSQLTAAPSSSSPTSSIVLSWVDNAANETGYRVERSTNGSTFSQIAQLGIAQSFTDSALTAGATYYYRVRAFNAEGNSAPSNTASAQTQQAAVTNTAPTVSISSPTNGSSHAQGASVTFSGSASDTEDGSLTASLAWTSSIDGHLGTGSGFTRTLSAGTHTITARAADSGGLSSSSSVNISIQAASTAASPSLSATAYKVKGDQRVDLSWTNLTTSSVDIYRSGVKVTTTANNGAHTDVINRKGGGSYSYKVCNAGSSVCTNTVTVGF